MRVILLTPMTAVFIINVLKGPHTGDNVRRGWAGVLTLTCVIGRTMSFANRDRDHDLGLKCLKAGDMVKKLYWQNGSRSSISKINLIFGILYSTPPQMSKLWIYTKQPYPQNPDKEQLIWELFTQPMRMQIAGLLQKDMISISE